jgi:hypothetical protein
MKLFKKNKNIPNAAARKIAGMILFIQNKFANAMDKVSASWKLKQQWIFLYLVCLVLGGLSVVAIIQPFKSKTVLLRPTSIHLLKLLQKQERKIIITDNEITRVHVFKQKLDSLSKTKEGKIKVDKFFNQRPGLFDSLEKVEQLYYSQKK